MKKSGILNSDLAKVIDGLGHTDCVGIGDLGLPVPKGVTKIDLALKRGEPKFIDVLDVYLRNVVVQKVFLANEMKSVNPNQLRDVLDMLPAYVEVIYVSHEELKAKTKEVRAVVRTGEDTAYSNIILESGVTI